MTSYDEGGFAAVFSPSLAKKQLLQAKDWDYVDQWLAKVYHPKPVPPFERNSETLKVLLSFATESENAEELDALGWKYKEFAVGSLEDAATAAAAGAAATGSSNGDEMDKMIADELSARFNSLLDMMAGISAKLGVVGADAEKLATALVNLQIENAELDRHVLAFERLSKRVAAGSKPVEELKATCDRPSFTPPPNLTSQLTEWTRTVKMLQQKSYEYKDRAASFENACLKRIDFKNSGIASFALLEQEIIDLREQVKSLEGRVRAFSGLPTESELAVLKVEEKLTKLQELVAKRDELYQKNV